MEMKRSPNKTTVTTDTRQKNTRVIRSKSSRSDKDVQQFSQLNHLLGDAHSSQGEPQVYIFEDNEEIIEMTMKGRSPPRSLFVNSS